MAIATGPATVTIEGTRTERATILVFGADKPLGKRIAYYLRHYARERNKSVTVIGAVCDVNDMAEVQAQVWGVYTDDHGSQRPTMVINANYQSSVGRLETDPEYAFRTNTHPAANIAIASRGADVPLIQISTDHVFKGNRGPYKNSDEVQPVNMFGVSMLYAERAVVGLYPVEWRGHRYPTGGTVVRLPALYGKGIESPPSMALDYSHEYNAVPVHQDVFGTPAFVGEAAFLIARNVVESPQVLAMQYIHCASPSEPISWYDLIKTGDPDSRIAPVTREETRFAEVRVGTKAGLVPTKGWALPQDYTKGFGEFMWERKHDDEWIKYW